MNKYMHQYIYIYIYRVRWRDKLGEGGGEGRMREEEKHSHQHTNPTNYGHALHSRAPACLTYCLTSHMVAFYLKSTKSKDSMSKCFTFALNLYIKINHSR